jgi:hypothetical protein
MGVLATSLASYGGSNPDTTHSFDANLAESNGDLTGVTAADAAAYATLFVIQDAGGTLEFGSFRDATLVSGNRYTLGGQLYRGLYGTTAAGHSTGAGFARLDENIFKFDLPAAWIGQTIYVKFQSFNSFGGGVQDLAACTAYSYVPAGTGFGGGTGGVPTTPSTPVVLAQVGSNLVTWAANPTTDNVLHYNVYRAAGLNAAFGSASLLGSSAGSPYTDSTAVAGTAYTYFIVAVNAVGNSPNSAGGNVGTQFGGAFECFDPVSGKPVAYLDLGTAWTLPSGLANSQGSIVDSDTVTKVAPTAQTDFDIQSPVGTSIGTMRFAASAFTATFIMASSHAIPVGQTVAIIAPSNLNGLAGAVVGSLIGNRTS